MEATWDHAVVLHLWTFEDCGKKEIGKKFLDTLRKFGFEAKKFGDEDPPKQSLDASSFDRLLELWSGHPRQLVLERLGRLGFQALLHLSEPVPALITFALHDEYFEKDVNTSKFVEFCDDLYRLFKPIYGQVSHKMDWGSKTVTITSMKVGGRNVNAETYIPVQPTKGLPGVFWANYLGPPYVNFYSNSKIDGAPAYNKKMFPDGGYLILTSQSPLDYWKPETKKRERDLIEYLGPDTVFDKNKPDRVLPSPFTTKKTEEIPSSKSSDGPHTISPNPRSCPECGEANHIQEVSHDPVNSMVGLRCLKCGARWLLHTSLI